MRTKPMRTLALVSLLLLSACDGAAPTAAPQATGLRLDGLANARVGMALTEAEAALGPLTVPSGVDPNACFYAKSETHPGVLVMMTEGALQRIDVREGATSSATGIRIGDAASKVQDTYGARVETLPHKYEWESGAQYLTIYDDTKTRAIRFVTSGGKVASFHAGNAEQVQYVEGCG
jgi:hypothetical protein